MKNMTSILMALIFLGFIGLFTGCTDASYNRSTERFSMPPELKDYEIYRLESKNGGPTLYVLVKKNGEDRPVLGTTQPGKVPMHTVVIDGEAYGKLEK
jgi:hypothetical protein